MGYNTEQLNIIGAETGKNILVSAAAGSGKTTVLVEKIVKMITNEDSKISLSNILVMTFTIKATAEMKARIKKKLSESLEKFSGESLQKVLYESETIQNANIYTIDAFCKRILEENYTALNENNSLYYDFDPNYRVGDANEIQVLKDEVLDELLEEKYADSECQNLFDAYINKSDESNLKRLFREGISFLSSIPWPCEYLTDQIENFERYSAKAYTDYTLYCKDLLGELKTKFNKYVKDIDELKLLCKEVLDSGSSGKGKALTDNAKEKLQETIEHCDKCKSFIDKFNHSELLISDKGNALFLNESEYVHILGIVKDIKNTGNSFPRKDVFAQGTDEIYSVLRDKLKECVESFNEAEKIPLMLNVSDNLIYNDNDKLFLKLLREYYSAIVNEKTKRNLYEISDYAAMALDILYDRKIDKDGTIHRVISNRAKAIENKYKLIFVDEYQDTNYIQEKILAAISLDFKKGNVFMVGDVKQSIYGFRKAEPTIFVDKQKKYNSGIGGLNMTLSTNYRSKKEIIYYVNDLFSKTMTTSFGDINYNDGNALKAKKEEEEREFIDENKVEIHVISNNKGERDNNKDSDNSDVDKKKYSAIDIEADYVANKIENLVKEKGCSYSDIVILLRSMKSKGKVYEDALRRHKIPAYAELKTGFFNAFEIKLMIDIFLVLDNPLNNVALASVISSSLFDFTNDELAFLKILSRDMMKMLNDNLTDRIVDASNKTVLSNDFDLEEILQYVYRIYSAKLSDECGSTEDFHEVASDMEIGDVEIAYFDDKINQYGIDDKSFSGKIKKYVKTFSELRFKSRYQSISDLIESIYETLDVRVIMSAMPHGRIRCANLDKLYDFALQFESSSYVGLFNFNKYLEKIKEIDNTQGQAKIYDESANVVRIMTIHSSKGLQFDTVFLCSAGSNYNFDDAKENSLVHFSKEYSVCLDYYDSKRNSLMVTPKKYLVAKKKMENTRQEELRMLYVALTRAEKKIYIIGSTLNAGGKGFLNKRYCEFVDAKTDKKNIDLDIRDCNSYLDIVLSSYPVRDESFCKFIGASWEINDTAQDFKEVDFDEMISGDNEEDEIISKNSIYFKNVNDDTLNNSINCKYYYQYYQKIIPKMSVSNMKTLFAKNNSKAQSLVATSASDSGADDVRVDKNMEDGNDLSGAELGNAYHKFMQFYNYKGTNDIEEQIKIDPVISHIDKSKIEIFRNTHLGAEMKKANDEGKLYREYKFMKLFSQNELDSFLGDNKKTGNIQNGISEDSHLVQHILNEREIVVQGIIDAFYIKKDKDNKEYIVLVDYKTDSLKKSIDDERAFEKELRERYDMQLDVYARALEEISGLCVREKYIYSFALNREILIGGTEI